MRATCAGALECINAGITTLVDWSHINNTPDHPDAGIQGLTEAGIRAAVRVRQREHVARRLLVQQLDRHPARRRDADPEHVLLLGRRAPDAWGWPRADPGSARTTWSARSGAWLATSASRSRCTSPWASWPASGAWSSNSRAWACWGPTPRTSTAATSATRSGSWSRRRQGHDLDRPPGGDADGARLAADPEGAVRSACGPSLSIDVVTTVPGDMFTEMRCAFAGERWRSNDSVWESEEPLPDDGPDRRDMLHDGHARRRARGRARGRGPARSHPASRPTSS